MSELHISISAETISNAFPIPITNSMFSSLIISGLLIFFAVMTRAQLQGAHRVPGGLQNVVEFIMEMIFDLVQGITNNTRKTMQFLPLFATFVLFILFNNWSGLIPGMHTIEIEVAPATAEHAMVPAVVPQAHAATPAVESHSAEDIHTEPVVEDHAAETAEPETKHMVPLFRAGTADINMTLALALVTVFSIQYFGISYLGLSYFGKFLNFSNPITFFVGILELVSEFARILSFAFRLFGNVFAGEVLLLVIASLSPIFFPILPIPFYGLELFVGFIQAVVFGMLSLVLYNMATASHTEH
jgi:F-type H+-transporting ATPase subunit a